MGQFMLFVWVFKETKEEVEGLKGRRITEVSFVEGCSMFREKHSCEGRRIKIAFEKLSKRIK